MFHPPNFRFTQTEKQRRLQAGVDNRCRLDDACLFKTVRLIVVRLGVTTVRFLPLLLIAILQCGCAASTNKEFSGHFISSDDAGVIVFRKDGVFGYQIPAKFDFFSESKLPWRQGRFRVASNGIIEISGIPEDWGIYGATLEVRDSGNTIILSRPKAFGGLPQVATYHRK